MNTLSIQRPRPSMEILIPAAISVPVKADRKSTRLNSSHQIISYAVFCLKKKRDRAIERIQSKYPRESREMQITISAHPIQILRSVAGVRRNLNTRIYDAFHPRHWHAFIS